MQVDRGGAMPREKRMLWQLALTLVLGLALWGMNGLPFPWAKEAVACLQEDVDWEELGDLSFVSAIFPEVRAVFAPEGEIALLAPVSGEQAQGVNAVAWLTDSQTALACADGRVFYAGEDRIYLLHDNGYQTRLTGIVPSLATGARVKRGEAVGTVEAGKTVTLTLFQDGRSLDPAAYLADLA